MKKTLRTFAFLLALVTIFSATVLPSTAVGETEIDRKVDIGTFSLGSTVHECIVVTETSYLTPSQKVHDVTYIIPVSNETLNATAACVSNIKSGIMPTAEDSILDRFGEVEFRLRVIEDTEQRYVQTSPSGDYRYETFTGINYINYGFYTAPDADGKVSVSDVSIGVKQYGYYDRPGTANGHRIFQDAEVNAPNYKVSNKNNLLTWYPPSSWKYVCDVESDITNVVGAQFLATVTNTAGLTGKVDLIVTAR